MGSQLQQLKAKLKTAGLSRSNSSSSKKDRKKDKRAHPDVRAKRLAVRALPPPARLNSRRRLTRR